MQRFAYFYLNRGEPERIREVVPAHVSYWEAAPVADHQGGPFADHTGGLILFAAPNLEYAAQIVREDPFVLAALVGENWLKEWLPE